MDIISMQLTFLQNFWNFLVMVNNHYLHCARYRYDFLVKGEILAFQCLSNKLLFYHTSSEQKGNKIEKHLLKYIFI